MRAWSRLWTGAPTGALATRRQSTSSASANSPSSAAAAANAETGEPLLRQGIGMPLAPRLLDDARRRRSADAGDGCWPSELDRRACAGDGRARVSPRSAGEALWEANKHRLAFATPPQQPFTKLHHRTRHDGC